MNDQSNGQKLFLTRLRRHRITVLISRVLILTVFLFLWELCARFEIIDSFIFSSPSKITLCFLEMLKNRSLFLHIGITLYETFISFIPLGGMHILKRLTARPYTTLLALTAESPSPPTAMQKENTALTPAILQTATKAVTGMSEDKFRSEMSYLAALSIAKNLREKGLLSEEEYAVIDTNLRAEFSSSLGTLLSENDLI